MKTILLVSHATELPNPIDKFYAYLSKKNEVFTIKHPLYLGENLQSTIRYKNKTIRFKIFPLLQYPLEGIISFWYFRKLKEKTTNIDLAICFDPLCFLHVYIFKKLLRIKKVVYHNLDYSKKRFQNPLLNFIYQNINIFAYRKCDYFFCITKKFTGDLDPKGIYDHKNFYIRHTAPTKKVKELPTKKMPSIVFAGTIGYNVNFNPVFEALQKIKQENIPFVLDIYGDDRKKGMLLNKVKQLGLQKYVSMKGIVDNKRLVDEILPYYRIGICPYVTKKPENSPDHAFLGTDLTLKLVEYIATGLPIITTRLFQAFDIIETKKVGFLVSTSQGWYTAIKNLLEDETLYRKYRANAVGLAKNYDENKVLNPIFKKILTN